jgi:hypothetical protein
LGDDAVGRFKTPDDYAMPSPVVGREATEGLPPDDGCYESMRSEGKVFFCRGRSQHAGAHVFIDSSYRPDGSTLGQPYNYDRIVAVEEKPDAHYRALGSFQPRDAIANWSRTWTGPTAFALGNIVKLAARYFTKNTPEYNLAGLKFYVAELERILAEEKEK